MAPGPRRLSLAGPEVAAVTAVGRRGRRDELGSSAPLTMALGLGVLVIPVFLLVLTVPTWEARTVDARDAARNAARALVTAGTWDQGVAAANRAVAEITANNGVPAADVTASYAGSLNRGAAVTATVTIASPDGNIPGIGNFGTFHYTASSTEQVDPYRSETP
jgi:hypothetical protein